MRASGVNGLAGLASEKSTGQRIAAEHLVPGTAEKLTRQLLARDRSGGTCVVPAQTNRGYRAHWVMSPEPDWDEAQKPQSPDRASPRKRCGKGEESGWR